MCVKHDMAETTNAELEAATASTDASEVPETSGTSTSEENISREMLHRKSLNGYTQKESRKLSLLRPC